MAVRAGDVSLVKEMFGIDDGEHTNSNIEGKRYLAHAALESSDTDMLDVVLEKWPSLADERNEQGSTSLWFGASKGYYKGVCNLLDRSTKNVFVPDNDGYYPIHIAVKNGRISVVKEILKRCPYSKNLLNPKKQNILHFTLQLNANIWLLRKMWRSRTYFTSHCS